MEVTVCGGFGRTGYNCHGGSAVGSGFTCVLLLLLCNEYTSLSGFLKYISYTLNTDIYSKPETGEIQ